MPLTGVSVCLGRVAEAMRYSFIMDEWSCLLSVTFVVGHVDALYRPEAMSTDLSTSDFLCWGTSSGVKNLGATILALTMHLLSRAAISNVDECVALVMEPRCL